MKNLEQIKNRLEDNNNFDNILAEKANVEDYYSQEYTDIASNNGFDFDLMFDIDEDKFFTVDIGCGKTFEQQNNCIFINRCEDVEVEETLVITVEQYIQDKE